MDSISITEGALMAAFVGAFLLLTIRRHKAEAKAEAEAAHRAYREACHEYLGTEWRHRGTGTKHAIIEIREKSDSVEFYLSSYGILGISKAELHIKFESLQIQPS